MKTFLTTLTLLLLGLPLLAQAPSTPPVVPPPTKADIGYSFGVLMGQSVLSTGLEFNLDDLTQGIKDAMIAGNKTRFDSEMAKTILTAAMEAHQAKLDAEKVEKEKSWLATHAKLKGVKTTASGLQYEVLTLGKGVLPKLTDTVKVNYVGSLTDGTEFDSSEKQGESPVFALNQVIAAWTEGIQLMPVGSKYRFTIPSSLAYGAQGAGELIPPFSTLVFEVELLSIEPPEAAPAPPAN